jgi:hypothetical protein
MEEEITKLQKCLQYKDEKLRLFTHSTEQVRSFLSLHLDLVLNCSTGVVTAKNAAFAFLGFIFLRIADDGLAWK